MAIKPIEKTNITDMVIDQLKQQILTGEWSQGDKLPSENELSDLMGVSRVTVRQAMNNLSAIGLIETKVGDGSYVKVLEPGVFINNLIPYAFLKENSVTEVMEFRLAIESAAAALAAAKATNDDITRLEGIIREMSARKGDIHAFSSADYSFHREIANITGNSLIIATYKVLENVMKAVFDQIVTKRGFAKGLYYHPLILEALRDRNAEKCRKLMSEHVKDTAENITKGK